MSPAAKSKDCQRIKLYCRVTAVGSAMRLTSFEARHGRGDLDAAGQQVGQAGECGKQDESQQGGASKDAHLALQSHGGGGRHGIS
jgi:hypothetical protein